MSLILSVLYRIRTRWKTYLILAALGAGVGVIGSQVVEPAVTAEYQVSGSLPLQTSLNDFGLETSQYTSTVVGGRILGDLESLTGASDANIQLESDAVLGTTILTMTGRKSLVDSGVKSISTTILDQIRTEIIQTYATLVERVTREIDSINTTVNDIETKLPSAEPDGRTVLLLQRSDLVVRREGLENVRANATALSATLTKTLPIQILRIRLQTSKLFGAPTWVLSLAIAVLAVILVSAFTAIFGQRAHTTSDVAGAFPALKVIGAPPLESLSTTRLEVIERTLHIKLSEVSLAEIALALAENEGIDSITAHYPNDSTFRIAIALGA